MAVKIHPIRRLHDLYPIATALKEVAREAFVPVAPIYARTEGEALQSAAKDAETIAADPHLRFLQYGPQVFFTLCLTIDTFEGAPRWHLSVSRASPAGVAPSRAPDHITGPIVDAFFGKALHTEGPPEGAFQNVRHFFAPYEAS